MKASRHTLVGVILAIVIAGLAIFIIIETGPRLDDRVPDPTTVRTPEPG